MSKRIFLVVCIAIGMLNVEGASCTVTNAMTISSIDLKRPTTVAAVGACSVFSTITTSTSANAPTIRLIPTPPTPVPTNVIHSASVIGLNTVLPVNPPALTSAGPSVRVKSARCSKEVPTAVPTASVEAFSASTPFPTPSSVAGCPPVRPAVTVTVFANGGHCGTGGSSSTIETAPSSTSTEIVAAFETSAVAAPGSYVVTPQTSTIMNPQTLVIAAQTSITSKPSSLTFCDQAPTDTPSMTMSPDGSADGDNSLMSSMYGNVMAVNGSNENSSSPSYGSSPSSSYGNSSSPSYGSSPPPSYGNSSSPSSRTPASTISTSTASAIAGNLATSTSLATSTATNVYAPPQSVINYGTIPTVTSRLGAAVNGLSAISGASKLTSSIAFIALGGGAMLLL